jgi:hypothetical protein
MNLWTCRGCASKDKEISRLVHSNGELLNRILALSGQPPIAPQGEPDEPSERELAKTLDEIDQEAEVYLEKLAERRGMKPADFADA